MRRTRPPREPERKARLGMQSGITLVEMLVALFILGVIFSAAAGALISFTQASLNNERRVQATALLNRLHEELQTVRWDDAALYEEELDDLAALILAEPDIDPVPGLDVAARTFDGLPLVTLEGPGCDEVTDPDCRIETIPRPFSSTRDNSLQPPPADGRDYDVFRFVTWAQDRDGIGDEDLKRFTTIVRWQVYGRTVVQRFDSERAPTPAELFEGESSIQFLVQPSVVELAIDAAGDYVNAQAISLTADFTFVGPMATAVAEFDVADGDDASLSLSRQGFTERFAGSIPAGTQVFVTDPDDFVDGQVTRRFQAVGTDADGTSFASAQVVVVFLEPDEDDNGDGGPTLTLTNPTVVATSPVVVGRQGNNDYLLCSNVDLSVTVQGGQPGMTVRTDYPFDTGSGSRSFDTAAVTGPGTTTLTLRFAAGTASPWRPAKPTGQGSNIVPGPLQTVTFSITATNPGDGGQEASIPTANEPTIQVQYSLLNSEGC